MKKSICAFSLFLSAALSTHLYGAVLQSSGGSTLGKCASELNHSAESAPVLIAHRPGEYQRPPVHHAPPPRPVVVPPPRPVVVPPPRPVVVPPPRPVVVPPPRPMVVIPDYGYGWWNNTYVPCYNNWYWYNGAWVWGGRGPRPVPPRWVPDFRRRPMPPAPPRPAPPRHHHRPAGPGGHR